MRYAYDRFLNKHCFYQAQNGKLLVDYPDGSRLILAREETIDRFVPWAGPKGLPYDPQTACRDPFPVRSSE